MESEKELLSHLIDRIDRIENSLYYDTKFAIYPETKAAAAAIDQINGDINIIRNDINNLEKEVYQSSWWNFTNILKAIPPSKWIFLSLIIGFFLFQGYQFGTRYLNQNALYRKYFFYFDNQVDLQNPTGSKLLDNAKSKPKPKAVNKEKETPIYTARDKSNSKFSGIYFPK